MFSFSGSVVRYLAVAVLAWLGACDSDKVSWAFVSNPGGTSGQGGGIIIIINNGGGSGRLSLEGDVLQVPGRDDRGPVTTLLPHGGDVAVLARPDGLELRSPALPQGRIGLPGARAAVCTGAAALRMQLPASERVHPAAAGPGVLHVAARGTLLVLESAAGLVVFGERPEPEVLPPKVLLTATADGARLAVLLGDGTLRELVPPPAPAPAERLQAVPARHSLRILGPSREVLAELPASCVQLQHGRHGLFLSAELPQGLPGAPGPFTLLMARDNRFLLRVDAR
jgi:hypothetical protein